MLIYSNVCADDSIVPLDNLVITIEETERAGEETNYINPRIGLKDIRKSFPIWHDSHPDGVCALINAADQAKSLLKTEKFENGKLPKIRTLTRYNIKKAYFNFYSLEVIDAKCDDSDTQSVNEEDYYVVSKKGLIFDKYIRKTCGSKYPKSYGIITCKKRH
ncbi:MAG: hypothetical protein R8G33_02980 [Gammaproteobacteria bacterium]|nr:hypothetical protein [Gammaproteobacteria bacterium]